MDKQGYREVKCFAQLIFILPCYFLNFIFTECFQVPSLHCSSYVTRSTHFFLKEKKVKQEKGSDLIQILTPSD